MTTGTSKARGSGSFATSTNTSFTRSCCAGWHSTARSGWPTSTIARPSDRWKRERENVRNAIEERGYNEERESFVQYFDADGALDATALLIPLYDFLPPEDERVQNTIDTILEELTTDGGLVFRFADSPARPREPGGFIICSCWLVDALALSGRLGGDRDLRVASRAHLVARIALGDDPRIGRNVPRELPQAFSHIGLLNSAIYLASASDTEKLPPGLSTGAAAPLFRRHGS